MLILDEATSALDSASEQAILQAMREVARNHTSVVIAHRLSTVQKASNIVVLDHGEIKEQGTHFELLELGGYYKKLFDMQFVD